MKSILVIDVAAESGGAQTVLSDYIDRFSSNKSNKYTIVLSNLNHPDSDNIHFINCRWVKKSYFHRLVFDLIYVYYLIYLYKPDSIISLQNNAYYVNSIPQVVLFHNALFLSEKQYKMSDSKLLWFYQKILSKYIRISLRKASQIIVQASWIKKALNEKWGIPNNKIIVEKPVVTVPDSYEDIPLPKGIKLFYPANGALYKNHIILLKAVSALKDKYPLHIILTGSLEDLDQKCRLLIESSNLPVIFTGILSKSQMYYIYTNSILVFPSQIETIGLPLLEVRMVNTGILAADCDYSRDVLFDYSRVKFFDPNSIDQLINSIESAIFEWEYDS